MERNKSGRSSKGGQRQKVPCMCESHRCQFSQNSVEQLLW